MKIGILGAGAMGSALYKNLSQNFNVTIYDHVKEKLAQLEIKNPAKNLNDFLQTIDCLIFAIKPQSLTDFHKETTTDLSNYLIVSVMAGVSLEKLKKLTGSDRIVRVMPNLAVSLKAGFSGWIASETTPEKDKEFLRTLLKLLGAQIEVPKEDLLHAITALAGSGPAYFFFLTECLAKEAKDFGLSEDDSQLLAKEVLKGTALLLANSDKTPKQMKDQVTSKKGTTEAALDTLKRHEFETIFHNAIQAAITRSKELEKNE